MSERRAARTMAGLGGAAAAVFLAAVLRLPALGYGLPATHYVDAFRFVDEARSLAFGDTAFTPQDFVYPGLLKILLAVVYEVFGCQSDLRAHLAARAVAAIFDLGTVGLVFALARRFTGAPGSTLAAALHAVSIIAVTSARIETADTTLTFFLTAALWALGSPALRPIHFLVGGLAVGCAAGTKLTGLVGLPLLPVAAWLWTRQGAAPRRAAAHAAGGTALLGFAFLASTPWLIPRLDDYRRALAVQIEVQRYGQLGHVQSSALDYLFSPAPTWEQPWLSSSLLGNAGPLVLAAGLASVAAALLGRLGPVIPRLLALYLAGYYLLVSGAGHVKAIRYLLPVLPVLWALTGAGVAQLAGWAQVRLALGPRAAGALLGAAALALLAFPAARTLPHLAASRRPLTNDLLLAWGRGHLPRGAVVLVSPFYVEGLRRLDVQVVELSGAAEKQYRAGSSLGSDTEESPLFRPELLASMRRSHIAYVVLSSYFEGALQETAENRRFFPRTLDAYRAFRERLAAEADPVFEARGQAGGRLGPDITVYRLR